MNLVKVKCVFCDKEFFRGRGRFNEAKKFGWNQYCSKECLVRNRTKKKVLFCENCGKIFTRCPNDIAPYNYCSQSCAAKVNNSKHPKRKAKLKTCMECGKQFRKSKGNLKYCSIKCRREAEGHTPVELLEIIRNTAKKIGRIPAKRELKRISDACRKSFGSWNNAIIAAGFRPNRSHDHRMYKRIPTKAIDGHLCDSVSEAIIDDWFTKNNIPHERDVPYPETNHKTDWVIRLGETNIFVEYFGLANDSPRYDRTIREKRRLCQKNKIRLIEIYHWDLYPKRRFKNKILRNLSKISISQGGETCTLVFRRPGPAS